MTDFNKPPTHLDWLDSIAEMSAMYPKRVTAAAKGGSQSIARLMDWSKSSNGELRTSEEQAAAVLGISEKTLRNHIKVLKEVGYLVWRKSPNNRHWNFFAAYPDDAAEVYEEFAAHRRHVRETIDDRPYAGLEKTEGDRNAEKFLANRTPSPSTEPVKAPAANAQPKSEESPPEEMPEAPIAVERVSMRDYLSSSPAEDGPVEPEGQKFDVHDVAAELLLLAKVGDNELLISNRHDAILKEAESLTGEDVRDVAYRAACTVAKVHDLDTPSERPVVESSLSMW